MKKIVSLLLLLMASAYLKAQCTLPGQNTAVELEAVSINAEDPAIYYDNVNNIGETTRIIFVLNNNGDYSIPVGDARVRITIPDNILAFGNLETFGVGLNDVNSGNFFISSSTPGELFIRNGSVFPAYGYAQLSFEVVTIGTGGGDDNLLFNTSLYGLSQCGDNNGANNEASGTIAVASGILPLLLQTFSVDSKDCGAALQWKTSQEHALSHFEVEYSLDGITPFVKLATIAATNLATGSQYSYRYSQGHLKVFAGSKWWIRMVILLTAA